MSKTNKNTPEIRFPGFTEPWEQRKLGTMGEFKNGMNFSKEAMGKGYPFVNLQNIFGRNIIDIENLGLAEASDTQLIEYNLQKGDVLFVRSSVKLEGVGEAAIVPVDLDNTTYSGFVIRFRDNSNMDCSFKRYVFATQTVRDQIMAKATNSANKNINQDVLNSLLISVPSKEEQNKVGTLLGLVDDTITLHQRKCDELKIYKKGMLQQMFPQPGELSPRVRFPGFTDSWEQRKLESLCDVFTDGDWIEAKDQSSSGIRLVQTGNVGTTEYLDKENNKKWISEETFERLHCEEIYEGDILISRLPEPAGRACIMPNLGTRMITAVDCTIVRTAKEFDSKYLVQYLSTPMYFKVVNSFLGGGTRQRISRGNLSGIDIPIPSTLEEQKRIGEYFANIDNLITLHQRKCDELKLYKKGLLQKMYV